MTDADLDEVRAVLDYMPADRYDDLPEAKRKLLASLDRRLNRTVAVKTREKVQVVVERHGEGAETVRSYRHEPDEPPARDVVLEPVESAEPEEAEPIPTPTATGDGPTELTLDEPPQPETREPIETEEWPKVEPEPEPTGDLGGFEPVEDEPEWPEIEDDPTVGTPFEPVEEGEGDWPEIPGESAAGADDEDRPAWPEPEDDEDDDPGVWSSKRPAEAEDDDDEEDDDLGEWEPDSDDPVPEWPDPDDEDD